MRAVLYSFLSLWFLVSGCVTPSPYVHPSANNLTFPTDEAAFKNYLSNLKAEIDDVVPQAGLPPIYFEATAEVNAYTLFQAPSVHVTRGMLAVVENEAQLVALLGHEYGHLVLHNSLNNSDFEKHRSTYHEGVDLADSLAGAILPDNSLLSALRTETREIAHAHWNQEQECEADAFGAELAWKLGYDPYAFARLFDSLSKVTQTEGILHRLKKLKASHDALDVRGQKIRAFLKSKGIFEGKGRIEPTRYQAAASPLFEKSIPEKLQTLEQFARVESQIIAYQMRGQPLSAAEFLSVMDELSKIAQTTHAENPKPSGRERFMDEEVRVESPLWEQKRFKTGNDRQQETKLESLLLAIGKMGVSTVPGVGDFIDLYEVATGKDFYTGEKLAASERLLAAAGLVAGSGQFYRQTARGVSEVVDVARKTGRSAATTTDATQNLRKQAEKSTAALPPSNGFKHADIPDTRTDLGKKWFHKKWFHKNGFPRYPPRGGITHSPRADILPPGTIIDRYGKDTGKYFSPIGTSYGARSLPFDQSKITYKKFEVVKPLTVKAGTAALWFGEVGGGTQYLTEKSVQDLLNDGYLKELVK